MTPALNNELLPAPDCAYTKTARCAMINERSSSVSRVRPKNRSLSSFSKGRGPTKGESFIPGRKLPTLLAGPRKTPDKCPNKFLPARCRNMNRGTSRPGPLSQPGRPARQKAQAAPRYAYSHLREAYSRRGGRALGNPSQLKCSRERGVRLPKHDRLGAQAISANHVKY